jgi:hypothetical protein
VSGSALAAQPLRSTASLGQDHAEERRPNESQRLRGEDDILAPSPICL